MSQADGRTRLQRIAFQVGTRWYYFNINPESMGTTIPHRIATIKTKSKIIVEDFQHDVPMIQIAGTTGYNNGEGIRKIRELKQFLHEYSTLGGDGRPPEEEFIFHNFTDRESYYVTLAPEGITYTRDVERPILHNYSINLMRLRAASEPNEDDMISPEVGTGDPSNTPSQTFTPPSQTINPQTPQLPATQFGLNTLGPTIGQ